MNYRVLLLSACALLAVGGMAEIAQADDVKICCINADGTIRLQQTWCFDAAPIITGTDENGLPVIGIFAYDKIWMFSTTATGGTVLYVFCLDRPQYFCFRIIPGRPLPNPFDQGTWEVCR